MWRIFSGLACHQVRVSHSLYTSANGELHMMDRSRGVACELRCVQADCGMKMQDVHREEDYERVSEKCFYFIIIISEIFHSYILIPNEQGSAFK